MELGRGDNLVRVAVLYQNRSVLPDVEVLTIFSDQTFTTDNKLLFWYTTSRLKLVKGRSFVLEPKKKYIMTRRY